MLIGAGEQKNGLYFFRGVEVASAVQNMDSLSISVWHRHLGHQSSKALEMLVLLISVIVMVFIKNLMIFVFAPNRQEIIFLRVIIRQALHFK